SVGEDSTRDRREAEAAPAKPLDVPLRQVPSLTELGSLFEELRTERRTLISRLHEHLDALSSCRRDMQEKWQRRPPIVQVESPEFRLQDDYGMTPREAEVARLLAHGLS